MKGKEEELVSKQTSSIDSLLISQELCLKRKATVLKINTV